MSKNQHQSSSPADHPVFPPDQWVPFMIASLQTLRYPYLAGSVKQNGLTINPSRFFNTFITTQNTIDSLGTCEFLFAPKAGT